MRVFVLTGAADPRGDVIVLGVYATRTLAEKDLVWYMDNGYCEVHIYERPLIDRD